MQPRSPLWGVCLVLASLGLPAAAAARASVPVVTFVEGTSVITSGTRGFVPAAGVRLGSCDIVRTGAQALMQVELDDGGAILIGPDSRILFDMPHGGEAVEGPHFLLSGWAKITVPKRERGAPYRVNTPHFDLQIVSGTALLRSGADGAQFYVEQGNAVVLPARNRAPAREAVSNGRSYARRPDQDRGTVRVGIDPEFAKAVPRTMRDTLPSLLAKVKDRDAQPKPGPEQSAQDSADWKQAVPELRDCFSDVGIREAQEALTRAGFDVGPVDGMLGPRTQAALREFQTQRGLSPSGQLDAPTLRMLELAGQR